MPGLPNPTQIAKLIATGKVAEVENEGMDEGRFFVHLKRPYYWAKYGDDEQRTQSFGGYREAMRAVKLNADPES